ncbi:uncharacterized protein N7446_005094 [Penicillium canescens]|uniref:Uncharacterized protein n=1 Tax=Penicillium canescens TaxID=5083 RepID=A0AAD6I954_PENCN|nr:uncharacterized protein N7446_005094 [Penicillium canescens]KAJ6038280.1 hypothetical protein N7460_008051 [Penicillium canescens]KAJ6068057.1 hypothetical protein N7446_005094 [Penicillium canescens]
MASREHDFTNMDDGSPERTIDGKGAQSYGEINTIQKRLKYHEYDYNFSNVLREKLASLMQGPSEGQNIEEWELQLKTETALNRFYSPYPEVRAVSTPTDDPTIPCETIRAHLLGYMWAIIAQFTNSLFNSRYPSITLESAVAQILLYLCGLFLAWVLPDWGFMIGGKRVSLNPGPWTYKEQMLSTIIIDVGLTAAYCFWNIQTQSVYYQDKWLTRATVFCSCCLPSSWVLGFREVKRRVRGQTEILETLQTEEDRVKALAKYFDMHLREGEIQEIRDMTSELV